MLAVLGILAAGLVVWLSNPWVSAAFGVVAASIVAEGRRHGRQIGRGVIWLATLVLPQPDRGSVRRDWLGLLSAVEETPHPLDFAMDAVSGIPSLAWTAWARRSRVAFYDEERRPASRLVVMIVVLVVVPGASQVVLFTSLGQDPLACLLALGPLGGPAYVAVMRRPHRGLEARRVLLTVGLWGAWLAATAGLITVDDRAVAAALWATMSFLAVPLVYVATGVFDGRLVALVPLVEVAVLLVQGESVVSMADLGFLALSTTVLAGEVLLFVVLAPWSWLAEPDLEDQLRALMARARLGQVVDERALRTIERFDSWVPEFYLPALRLASLRLPDGPVTDVEAGRLLAALSANVARLPTGTPASYWAARHVSDPFTNLRAQVLRHFRDSADSRVAASSQRALAERARHL